MLGIRSVLLNGGLHVIVHIVHSLLREGDRNYTPVYWCLLHCIWELRPSDCPEVSLTGGTLNSI